MDAQCGIAVAVDKNAATDGYQHAYDSHHSWSSRYSIKRSRSSRDVDDQSDRVRFEQSRKPRFQINESARWTASNKETLDLAADIDYRRRRRHQPNAADSSRHLSPPFAATMTELVAKVSATYSVRFQSPKWTDFKGVSLAVDEKIRMNNLIWREWHRQFVLCQKRIVCKFTCLLDDSVHSKAQAVVLEGKYWQRKFDAVVQEYHEWRNFWRTRRAWMAIDGRQRSRKHSPDEVDQPTDFQVANVAAEQRQQWTMNGCCSQPLLDLDAIIDRIIANSTYPSDLTKQDVDSQGNPAFIAASGVVFV